MTSSALVHQPAQKGDFRGPAGPFLLAGPNGLGGLPHIRVRLIRRLFMYGNELNSRQRVDHQ